MEKFYIFLDIDGVMWNWNWRRMQVDNGIDKKGGLIRKFKPESVDALNYLLKKLSNHYDPILVISSTWRRDMDRLEDALLSQGVEYHKPMLCTAVDKGRTKEIRDFIEERQVGNRYVVIDDEFLPFKEANFIHTNIFDDALDKYKVDKWLNFRGLSGNQSVK